MAKKTPRFSAEVSDDPDRFEQAVRAFRDRVPILRDEFEGLSAAAKQRAFSVAGTAQLDVISDVWEAVDRAVADGTGFDEFKDAVGETLESEWGGEIPGRLESIFRTNVQSAYSVGRQRLLSSPAVRERRPYLRFDAVVDDRTSDICAPLDGTVLPADDPFWKDHTPPLHYQCRSTVVALTADEAAEEGIDEEAPESDVDEGFGASLEAVDEVPLPDPEKYPERLRKYAHTWLRRS